MNDFGAEPGGQRDKCEQQQAVVRAAALGNRHDRQPLQPFLRGQPRACERTGDGRQRVDEIAGQDAGHQAQRHQHEHGGQRARIGLNGIARDLSARSTQKRDPECLDEAGRRKRGGKREQRADRRHEELQQPLGKRGAEKNRLKSKPLGDEAVERRQGGDRRRPDQERESRERHSMDQSPQVLHVALAGGGQHRARPEEQQALEHAVIEDVKQRRGQRESSRGGHRVCLEGERKT